jgi:antitoxin VapB
MMSEQRKIKLLRSGGHQVVRIPFGFELPSDEAIMHRHGDQLTIEPLRRRGLVALLRSMKPLKVKFPEIDDDVPSREIPTNSRASRA